MSQEFDNTNTGVISAGDKGGILGNINIEGTNYRFKGDYDAKGNIVGDLIVVAKGGINPFDASTLPSVAGQLNLHPVVQRTPTSPSTRGFVLIGNKKFLASGWLKIAKKGNNAGSSFYSLMFQTEKSYFEWKAQKQAGASVNGTSVKAAATAPAPAKDIGI